MSNESIPWFEPVLDQKDREAVADTVTRGYVNAGPANAALEEQLCAYFGVPHASFVPSGTMAIALSLMAAGVGAGDFVLVPDFTFIGTASAVRLCGAEPILVDVDPDTFVMTPASAEAKMDQRAKAIVPVHLNGRAADMAALRALAEKHELALIEDAAEALGSRNAQGFLGAQSDAGCFSLAPTKIITSGQGGFVLTSRADIHEQIIRLKDHGRLSRASDEHPVTGYNFKTTDMQAALALSQWEKLEARVARVQEIDKLYIEGLGDIAEISFTERPLEGHLMWPDFKTERRDELVQHMRDHNIALRPFWPPIHTQPAYESDDPFPGADETSAQACWLPCSPNMTDDQLSRVIETMRAFYA